MGLTLMIALSVGAAAGLRPYFVALILGLAKLVIPAEAPLWLPEVAATIPETLSTAPMLIGCGVLALGDFGIDKIVGVNVPWAAVHTFARPVIGALLGLGIGSHTSPSAAVISAVLGGGATTAVSLGRDAVVTCLTTVLPEPVSQTLRSFGEDGAAVLLIVSAIVLPVLGAIFAVFAVGVGILLFLLLRKALRAVRQRYGRFQQRRRELLEMRRAQRAAGQGGHALHKLSQLAHGNSVDTVAGVPTPPAMQPRG